MRPVVAIVEASPDTIRSDYERVLNLAGLDIGSADGSLDILAAVEQRSFCPGFSMPPWQLEALVTGACGGTAVDTKPAVQVFALDTDLGPATSAPEGWDSFLRDLGVAWADDMAWQPLPLRRTGFFPALAEVLPGGPQAPAGLKGESLVLLGVPRLDGDWPVRGSVDLLVHFLGAGVRPRRPVPASEIRAEAVGLAREVWPELAVVLDGTYWGIGGSAAGRRGVGRNVLIAGTDPVATDAIALHLAGGDPRRTPWMRLCRERGFGENRPEEIVVKGRTDLLGRDFELVPDRWNASVSVRWVRRMQRTWWKIRRRPAAWKEFLASPWGRLYLDRIEGNADG